MLFRSIADFDAIPKNKPAHPLRVGVVGEYFTIMDPYSNHEIEKKLAQIIKKSNIKNRL